MVNLAVRLSVVFLLAMCADIVAGIHIRSLVENRVALAVLSVIGLHLLGFPALLCFVNYPDWRRRLAITVAGSLGAAVGTIIVIRYEL